MSASRSLFILYNLWFLCVEFIHWNIEFFVGIWEAMKIISCKFYTTKWAFPIVFLASGFTSQWAAWCCTEAEPTCPVTGSRSLFTAPMHVSLATAGHTASSAPLSHSADDFFLSFFQSFFHSFFLSVILSFLHQPCIPLPPHSSWCFPMLSCLQLQQIWELHRLSCPLCPVASSGRTLLYNVL